MEGYWNVVTCAILSSQNGCTTSIMRNTWAVHFPYFFFRPLLFCGSTVPPRVHLSPHESIGPIPGSTAGQLQQTPTICGSRLPSLSSHVLLRVGYWRLWWRGGGCSHIQNIRHWSGGQEQCCMMGSWSVRMSGRLDQQLRKRQIWAWQWDMHLLCWLKTWLCWMDEGCMCFCHVNFSNRYIKQWAQILDHAVIKIIIELCFYATLWITKCTVRVFVHEISETSI